MKITCPSCGASYNVDDSRIPANGMTMRCPKCSHSFRVMPDGAAASESPNATAQAGAGTILDGSGHAIQNERYYVKRPTGKVFGPFDGSAVEMMLKTGKLSSDAEVSTDKVTWAPLSSIPLFSKYAKSGPIPDLGGVDPKSTMMGGWQKQNESGVPAIPGVQPTDLPASAEAGLPVSAQAGLPASASAGLPVSAGSDLPASAQPGLPVSAGSNLPASAPGLPVSAGSDLPASAAGLPASASAGLPASKAAPGLPQPKNTLGLPKSRPPSIPAPKVGLPKPGGPPSVPPPGGAGAPPPLPGGGGATPGIPMPDAGDDLFGGGQSQGSDTLFGASPSAGSDDLFGEPAQEESEDLFGGGGNDDDLFGRGDDDDDLFGGAPAPQAKPAPTANDDDLFGTPASEAAAPSIDEDDLFGTEEHDDDDLFIERDEPAGKEDGDDFLGGDAGFSFLDDAPPPEEDDWGDDLFGDESSAAVDEPLGHQAVNVQSDAQPAMDDWGDELLEQPAAKKPKEQIYDDDDAFRPMSAGIREEEEIPEEALEGAAEQVDDRGRGKIMMVAVPVLLIVLVGVGYGVYTAFFSQDTVEQVKKAPVGPVGVDFALVQPDNYSDYLGVIDKALQGKVADDDAAKLLVVESLFLSRYDDQRIRKDAEARAAKYQEAAGGMEALGRGGFEAQQGNADAARAYLEPLLSGSDDEVFYANLLMGIGDVRAVEKEVEAGNLTIEAEKKEQAVAEADAGQADAGADAGSEAVAENTDMGSDVAVVEKPKEEPKEHPLLARAVIALKGASDANPESPLPNAWLARVAKLKADQDGVVKNYKAAVKKSPTHVASMLALGETFYDGNDLNESISYLEKITGELAANASVSERAKAHHYSGLVYVARRQSDLAIDNFTKALQIDPSRTETLRALALEYEAAKKYKEALNFFKTNKNLGQKEPEVVLGIVRSHIGLEQWNAAITALEEAQKTFPEDARFPFYLGKLNRERGDFLQAKKAFEAAVGINPQLLTAHTALAQLAWRMDKDMQSGEEHIAEVVKYPDMIDDEVSVEVAKYYHMSDRRRLAESWYRAGLSKNPNSWPARLALSKLLLEENKYEEAQALLEKARDEGVQDIRLAAYLADAYRQSGDFDRAVEEINKVIEQFPKNEEYVFIRGRIQFDRGNYETAREDFSRAYDLNPRYHDAYFYVGRTAFEKGDHQTALKIFRHVLDYQPNRGEFRFYMARALEMAGRTSQALDEYRKATAVDEDYGDENPSIYIYRGRLLTNLGYGREGKADVRRALDLAPEMNEALLAMGEIEYVEKNYEDAIGHFKKALEKDPERPEAQHRLGMSQIYAGQQREGAQRLQLAIKYGYENPEVYRTLGYLYKELGQRSAAKESFEAFLKQTEGKKLPVTTRREILSQIKSLGG